MPSVHHLATELGMDITKLVAITTDNGPELSLRQEFTREEVKEDVVTRWGSKVEIMQRIMEQLDAIQIVFSQDRKVSHLVPTWQDFDVLESVLEAVKSFADLTDLLSGEKRVSYMSSYQATYRNHQQ